MLKYVRLERLAATGIELAIGLVNEAIQPSRFRIALDLFIPTLPDELVKPFG